MSDEHTRHVATWDRAILDLADGVIRVIPTNSALQCGACRDRRPPDAYGVYIDDPIVPDSWHRWGVVCRDCMTAVVSVGGTPIPFSR